MNISEVTTALKVGESVRIYDNPKKNWDISWVENIKKITSNKTGRVYLIVSNGKIKKIGGSKDKGGIRGTLKWYVNSALVGSPSVRTYAIHILITEELDKGNKVEFYVIPSEKVKLPVKGLFGEEMIYTSVDFKSMEDKCKGDYYNIMGKHPEWNIQEKSESWPIHIREGCDTINNNSTKKSKQKKNENTN